MALDLSVLKQSLRLEDDETADDTMLTGYLSAAQNFVKQAIGADNDKFYTLENVVDLYNTAVIALASDYYNNRLSLSQVNVVPIDLTINSIIGQLRGLELVTDGQSN